MHEFAVTRELVRIVVEEATAAGAVRVDEVKVVLGRLRGFRPECIEHYYTHMAKGTVAEGASLTFEEISAAFRCEQCGHRFELEEAAFCCPACGSISLDVECGNEFYIASIDADVPG